MRVVKSCNFRDSDGVVLVVFEDEPDRCFVVGLDEFNSLDSFKSLLKGKSKKDFSKKLKFDSLALKSLVGVDLDA